MIKTYNKNFLNSNYFTLHNINQAFILKKAYWQSNCISVFK
jgi:hypothetical protein